MERDQNNESNPLDQHLSLLFLTDKSFKMKVFILFQLMCVSVALWKKESC